MNISKGLFSSNSWLVQLKLVVIHTVHKKLFVIVDICFERMLCVAMTECLLSLST